MIDTNVPLPMQKRGRKYRYPDLVRLKVRQSTTAPIEETEQFRNALYHYQKTSGKRFISGVDEQNPKLYRAWRTR